MNITQSEWLTCFWEEVYKGEYSRYALLKEASKTRGREEPMPRKRLKSLRDQFIVSHVRKKKFPKGDKCFLCSYDDNSQYFLIRHHIIALSKWGSNRQINIVTLCSRCHVYFHPWLKATLSEFVEDEYQKSP